MYNRRMAVYTSKRPSYRQVVAEVMQLSRRDQNRLREELAKITGVHLVQPKRDEKTVQAARQMAEEVRQIVQKATAKQTLEETMSQLRGRSWS